MTFKSLMLAGAAAALFPLSAVAQDKPAALSDLIGAVDLPYQQFTLDNGLRVIVHTDRKAPLVAVSIWYNVGSKHEPEGKSGFAHLFEHLMFNGSENAPGDFFAPLKDIGATDYNGNTYFDRTSYFETVPTTALDRALFLESDRMGWLTGAIDQATLDAQRGVVQNEKRQGDNRPYGLVQYKMTEGLFPASHPYGHTPIGSMADLDAASLADVKGWFHDHYGPNNAVLSLAGDIDVATARTLVQKYFGGIARGPETHAPTVDVVTLPRAIDESITDQVANAMVMKAWTVPGLNDKDAAALDVAAGVLGGLASSRLDTLLVRKEKLAVSVSAYNSSLAQAGTFVVQATARPGVDPAMLSRRLDAIIAELLANGPTKDEVARVAMQNVSATIEGLESVGGAGGKAAILAQGELYSGDPAYYRKQLDMMAAQTPAMVRAAVRRWLSRPAYSLTVKPGPRPTYAESSVPARASVDAPDRVAAGNRGPLPPGGDVVPLRFPAVEHVKLSNGIELIYAHQPAIPFTRILLSLDAGIAADPAGALGTQQLMLSLLDQGAAGRDTDTIAKDKERLGIQIGAASTLDRTTISLSTPSVNLAQSLNLFSDIVLRPDFAETDVARQRDTQLSAIAQEMTSPGQLAARALPARLYGADNPYGRALGSGDPVVVAKLMPIDLRHFHDAWVRPEKATFFITSDRPITEVRAALEAHFAQWRGNGVAGVKVFPAVTRQARPASIQFIDRPGSPQSYILGGFGTSLDGSADTLPLQTANDALGGDFLSRMNMDIRERKHWSYGVRGAFQSSEHDVSYLVRAPVQADRTGDSLKALQDDMTDFLTAHPMTDAEFQRTVTGAVRSLPGAFETSGSVLAALQRNSLMRRPDDYYATITAKYQGMTLPEVNKAIQDALHPREGQWIVVGDAKSVLPQLETLGIPVEVVKEKTPG